MTAEEMWKRSGLTGEYTAWAFGKEPDELALLVKKGNKTVTNCSQLNGTLNTSTIRWGKS